MNYTDKILAEFDIAFPEVGTYGWIGGARYPADLCCGANFCSPNCDKRKREAIKAFISESIAQAEQEMYIQGFKDGFQHSTEGFNGEYQHPDVPKLS